MNDIDREPGSLESDDVEVRTLREDDLEWVVRIDAAHSRCARTDFFRVKLREAQSDTGMRISLAAFVGGEPAGFLMGRMYYGEFGIPDSVAILDSIGVAPAFTGKHVGSALMRQLRMNLGALGVERILTEVDDHQEALLRFFRRQGFRPAPRVCLELKL